MSRVIQLIAKPRPPNFQGFLLSHFGAACVTLFHTDYSLDDTLLGDHQTILTLYPHDPENQAIFFFHLYPLCPLPD